MTEELERLRDQYYQAIKGLQEKEDILEALPTPEYHSFHALINGIINLLENDIQETKSLLTILTSKEEIEEAEYIIELDKNKLKWCKELLENEQEIIEEEEKTTLSHNRTIIFPSSTKNILSMIKGIPHEYYHSVLDCLESIKTNHPQKNKKLSSSGALIGMWESKEFKVRILYKLLPNNCVYVFIIRMKKDTKSTIDEVEPVNKFSNCKKDYKKLRILLKNKEESEIIKSKNQELLEQLEKHLTKNGRGHSNV